jgi:hypothetical protein
MRFQLLYRTMQGSSFYFKITYAIDFVIPIPAFLFFDADWGHRDERPARPGQP